MQRKAHRVRRAAAALTVCAALGLAAGCSANTGIDDGGLTGEPVKVGMIGDPVGLASHIAVAKAAINALNDRGGLDGHPVELVFCDDKLNPNVTTNCGRKMVDDGVVAIVGGGATNGNVLVPLFEDADIASIGVTVGDPQQATAENYFFFSAGEPVTVMAAYSGQAGLATSVFAVEMPDTQVLLEPSLTAAEEAGTPVVKMVLVPLNTADYAPVIASAEPDVANAALLVVAPGQEPSLVQSALSSGWSPTWLLDADPQREVQQLLNDAPESDVVYTSPFPALNPDSDDPDVKRYFEELQKYGADKGIDDIDDAIEFPSYTEVEGWLAVQVLAQLVDDGSIKELTPAGVLAALEGVDGLDIGLVESWVPNVVGPDGVRGGNFGFNIVEVHNGEAVTLSDAPVTAEQLVSGEVSVPAPAGLQ